MLIFYFISLGTYVPRNLAAMLMLVHYFFAVVALKKPDLEYNIYVITTSTRQCF
jgi:hypothetical protein